MAQHRSTWSCQPHQTLSGWRSHFPAADEEDGFRFWPPRVVSCSAVRLHGNPNLVWCLFWRLLLENISANLDDCSPERLYLSPSSETSAVLFFSAWTDVLDDNKLPQCWVKSFIWHLLTSNKSTNQQLTINTANLVRRDSFLNNPTFQRFSHELTLSWFRLIATDSQWWFFGAQGVQKKKKRLLAEYDKNAGMKEEWPHWHRCRLFLLEGQICRLVSCRCTTGFHLSACPWV